MGEQPAAGRRASAACPHAGEHPHSHGPRRDGPDRRRPDGRGRRHRYRGAGGGRGVPSGGPRRRGDGPDDARAHPRADDATRAHRARDRGRHPGPAVGWAPWRLELSGSHTLVVGRSGSGKGSVFWGIAGNLAPAAHAGLVRLWGVDLKGGVEVAVGSAMFSHVAMDEQAALRLLRSLNQVIVARQAGMRGHARTFEATAGDPAHVLLIDELAVLTGYASRDVVSEASALLKRILTQGRALGVMVVAFVQDPRKETVAMRELFTQTIALRVASTSETRMVLGDGYADLAPAHRIDRTMPGAGYVVGNDGVVERVRADFWSDDLIRLVASRYPAPPEPPTTTENTVPGELITLSSDNVRRTPRTPRGGDDPEPA
nr:FtsK/SpoIIIE domain-containing protein [Xylanimonas protaetiae]